MKFRVKPSSPLIIDRWIDVTYAALWAIYSFWGGAVMIAGLPTLNAASPDWYRALWSGCVGLLAFIACISAVSLFFQTRVSFITKKKVERAAVIALSAFIALYPVLLIWSAVGGDTDRIGVAVLSISYLLFPGYRIYLLGQRIKAYEAAAKEITHAAGE